MAEFTPPTPRQRSARRVGLSLNTDGGASSADAAGADINKIMAIYRKHGTLPRVPNNNPLYGDFTFPENIHEIREAIAIAEDRFRQLPADVRSLCDHDMVTFHDKFNDPDERQTLVAAGLQIGPPQTPTTLPPEPAPNDNMPPSSPPASTDTTTTDPTPS